MSFSPIKCWFFSRILSLALSGAAKLVLYKPGVSKKKYMDFASMGVKYTQRKTGLSNENSLDDLEPLVLQLHLEVDL